jgi:hypothetical protein
MKRSFSTLLLVVFCATAHAHFTFVVPETGGTKARVIISENLSSDAAVDFKLIGGTKLSLRGADGHDAPLMLQKAEKSYEVSLTGSGTRVIHGLTDLGIMQRGNGKPHLLLYYPKAILGDSFDTKTIVGGDTPVELVPMGKSGAVKLKLLARGKPLEGGEITIILPDGAGEKKVKTDSNGETETFAATGRFGAWARFWETSSGERDGKKYDELRHYATIVFDAGSPQSKLATMPQATSSFGAVENSGWLYIYGGHISPTHTYFEGAVSGAFNRLNLNNGKWEELPSGPPLQGLNLAVHNGKIYRIGGMAPRNKKGAAADNHSTAECARFDPGTRQWEPLPSLPEQRSSHDVVVVGDQLLVTGGWTLAGPNEHWVDTLALLDLSAKKLEWKTVAQPFRRRALITAAFKGKLYVLGGFNDKNQIVRDVSIFDPKTGEWAEGPELPKGAGLSFAPASVVHNGRLYVSISDGALLRLNESLDAWEKIGNATGRVAHRLAAHEDKVLVIGGASGGKNFDLIEAVPVAR